MRLHGFLKMFDPRGFGSTLAISHRQRGTVCPSSSRASTIVGEHVTVALNRRLGLVAVDTGTDRLCETQQLILYLIPRSVFPRGVCRSPSASKTPPQRW
jgi:hypothetical protein